MGGRGGGGLKVRLYLPTLLAVRLLKRLVVLVGFWWDHNFGLLLHIGGGTPLDR